MEKVIDHNDQALMSVLTSIRHIRTVRVKRNIALKFMPH